MKTKKLNLKLSNSLTHLSTEISIDYEKSMQPLDVYFELCEMNRDYDTFISRCVEKVLGRNTKKPLLESDPMYWSNRFKYINTIYECINTTTIKPLNLSLIECRNLPTNEDIIRHHKIDMDSYVGDKMLSQIVQLLPDNEVQKFFEEERNVAYERRCAVNEAHKHFNESKYTIDLDNLIELQQYVPVLVSNDLSSELLPEHKNYLDQLFDEIKKKHSWYYDLRNDLIDEFKSKYHGITEREIEEYLREYM